MLPKDTFRSLRLSLTLCFLAAPLILHAQIPIQADTDAATADVKLPSFDTVSVKENKSGTHTIRIMNKPNGFQAENVPVSDLISIAYGIRQDLVSGLPDWTHGFSVDVNAKIAEEDAAAYKKLTNHQRNAMVQAMLRERLNLQVHNETRTLPVYDLVIDKGGPKLPVSTAPEYVPGTPYDPNSKVKAAGSTMTAPGKLSATAIPLASLTNMLAYTVGRTVIDKTGLTGKYDIELKWTPEGKAGDNGADDVHGDIFAALHDQLGLKLIPGKGPVETLVVDHIDKPSEN